MARERSSELRGLLEETKREHHVNRALMSQELASTVSDPSSDSSSGGSSGASGLMGGDSASSGYAGMLNQTLTSSIMSGGGTGIAMQIAKSIDPALAHPTADKSQGAAQS